MLVSVFQFSPSLDFKTPLPHLVVFLNLLFLQEGQMCLVLNMCGLRCLEIFTWMYLAETGGQAGDADVRAVCLEVITDSLKV